MQYLDEVFKSGLFQKISRAEWEKALASLVITERKGEKETTLFYEVALYFKKRDDKRGETLLERE